MKRILLTCALVLSLLPAAAQAQSQKPAHIFAAEGDHFTLDGKPFKVISGELHYARIPREYWHARLRMAKAMGLNTIATYVFWNVHEPQPGHYDFSGQYDLAAFVKAAQQEGLYVILRSGPYACAEWDLGGLPAWLLADPKSAQAIRTTDPAFMVPAKRWITRWSKEVLPLQIGRGGPILMTQIENEYGQFGDDHAYIAALRDIYTKVGFNSKDSLLYTADNWRHIPEGSIPGLFAATNFGIGNHQHGMDNLATARPGQALFVSEYWPGWFDHWGHPHETCPVAPQIADIDYILNRGAGINIYMFHGGTSFGFMAGSSYINSKFLPDVTSYDYDAPLDESGRPTPKYYAYRKELAKFSPCGNESCLPPVPPSEPIITISPITLTESASLWQNLPKPIVSALPAPMETFGQNYGYILYRTQLPQPVHGSLVIKDVHDFAAVYIDGKLLGTRDRRDADPDGSLPPIQIDTTGSASLDILVANDGRVNVDHTMRAETKGVTQLVVLDGRPLSDWRVYLFPMDSVPQPIRYEDLAPKNEPFENINSCGSLPANAIQSQLNAEFLSGCSGTTRDFLKATFTLASTGDTFLDTRNLGKGAVWIMVTIWGGSGASAPRTRSTFPAHGSRQAATRSSSSTCCQTHTSPFPAWITPFWMVRSATKPPAVRNNGTRRNSQLAAPVFSAIRRKETLAATQQNRSWRPAMIEQPNRRPHAVATFLPIAALAIATVLSFTVPPPLVAQAPASSIATLHNGYVNPPNEARPMVRWWWFGPAVVKPEILRELQQMKADGIQGAELAFEYAEVLDDPAKGLKNLPFLSPEMLDDVNYAQAEGRKLGLRIDLTLCSGWPYGGPSVPLSQAITSLRVAQVPVPAGATSVAIPGLQQGESLVAADVADEPASTVVATPAPAGPGGGFGGRGSRGGGASAPSYDAASAKPLTVAGSTASFVASDKPRTALFFILSHPKMQVKRAAVGAEGYVLDHFSHEAVADYLKDVGQPLIGAFGATPPYAIFSDSLEVGGSSWTPDMPAEFRKLRGYDLIPHLPELFAGGNVAADTVRHDYGETLTDLVNENYLKQITDFAVAHHTKFRSQTYGEPAVDFSSQNIPQLAEGEGPQWRGFSTLRWATSANHVFGHNVTSGETFTWLHSPVFRAIPLDMKAEADIDFIMGENQIMCHGWPYSPPDAEVPEPGWSLYAAAVFNNHNPWHPVMPAVTAYIGRMSYILRQGKPANQVVVLLPTDDAWATFVPGRDSVTGDMGRYVTPALMSTILSAGYNVDFIDAKAIDKVGLGDHQILILPTIERIPVETLNKIAAYVKSGGKAIAFGHEPTLTPEGKPLGEAGGDTSEIALVPDEASLTKALNNAAKPDFQISATDEATVSNIGFIRRKLPNADIYFVTNTGNQPIDVTATFGTTHKYAEEWDTDNANVYAATVDGQAIHLEPYGARVYVFSDTRTMAKPAPKPSTQLADLSSGWKVAFPSIQKAVDESTLTDWTSDPSTLHYSGEGVYTRDFTLAAAPKTAVFVEFDGGKPEQAPARAAHIQAYYDPPIQAAGLISVNGQPAGALWHPPYRLDISKLLKAGKNTIEIRVYNTALNAWSALPKRDYAPLIAKYGDKFQMQDLNLVAPVSSGILGSVHLVTEAK